jgi:hypothetical protein
MEWYRRVNGQLYKYCTGPGHDEPTYLPATEKYFYRRKIGKRKGEFLSRCRLCTNWAKLKSPGSYHGYVEVAKARPIYAEAANRIGLAELARRTGLNPGSINFVITGRVKHVQKAKLRLVMLELISIRRNGESSASRGAMRRARERMLYGRTDICPGCHMPADEHAKNCSLDRDRMRAKERRKKDAAYRKRDRLRKQRKREAIRDRRDEPG